MDGDEIDELTAGFPEELLDEESSVKDELEVDGWSLLESGSLADGVLLSPDDDGEEEPLSTELLSEELPLEVGGDDELGGVEELGADDDGVLGVVLLDEGAELEGILSLEELSLCELLDELLEELLDDEELLDELEQQSQQQQPAW